MPREHISSVSPSMDFVRVTDIWKQISLFEKYAGFIPEVDKVDVLSENRSEWFISLDNAPFTWVEVDSFDNHKYILKFCSIGGDFESFEGCWKIIRNSANQIKLSLEFDYYLGIPVLEDLINNVLKQKMQKFADSMVKAHSERVQLLSNNTRLYNRFQINDYKTISIDGRTIEANIVNVSNGGIMFILNRGIVLSLKDGITTVNLDTIQITGNLRFEPFCQMHRIVFTQKLSDEKLLSLLSRWNGQSDSELVKVFEVLTSENYSTSDEVALKS